MKVNFNVAFKNFDGKDVTETYQEVVHEEVNGVVKDVVKERVKTQMIYRMVASILFVGKECKDVDEKMVSFNLSQRIYNAKGAIEITTEEAALIKKLVADSLIAGAYAQVVYLLEMVHQKNNIMEIVSNKINQIATSRISESIINTYTYSQDVGDPIVNIRIETSKNGNKVAGTDYMGASNRLLLDMNDYKALDLGERKAIVSAILDDVETILSGKNENSV